MSDSAANGDSAMDGSGAAAASGGSVIATGDLTSKDYYFDSYAHFGIHEEMIKDTVRTETYRRAIMNNPQLIKDKIVLDVGCGTAILSMFAAKAGAKHVYAIDCSNIIIQAQEIVRANGFADRITLIKGKMEDIVLPVEKVDVIISEWMGYALLYESMLNTVLLARDRYLVPNGVLLPDKASIFVSAIEDFDYKESKINWWNSVYGFDMSCIRKLAVLEPLVDVVSPEQIVTGYSRIFDIDINTVTIEQLSFDVPFVLTVNREDYVHALVLHFDIDFSRCHGGVTFSTSPNHRVTHWKQTVLYLEQVLMCMPGEQIRGRLKCYPHHLNHRDLNFELQIDFQGQRGAASFSQHFYMR